MAKYVNKTWTDRVSEQPQRRLLTPTDGSSAMTVDVTRQEGIVIQEGDAFSASNMNDLEQRIKTAVDANDSAITSVTQKANTNQQNISTLSGTVTTVNSKVTAIEGELTANGTRIYMDYKNGKYGYNTSANRGADTFHPFRDLSLQMGGVVIGAEKTTKTFTVPAGTYYFAAVASCHHSNANRATSSIAVNGSTIIACVPNEVDKGVNASTTMALGEGSIVSISANYVSNQEGVSAAGFYRIGD